MGSHVGGLVGRVSEPQLGGPRLQLGHELAVHVLVNQDALGGRADLTGQVEAAEDRAVDGGVDIRVAEDDLRAVATELEQLLL